MTKVLGAKITRRECFCTHGNPSGGFILSEAAIATSTPSANCAYAILSTPDDCPSNHLATMGCLSRNCAH